MACKNYLVFQPVYKYLKNIPSSNHISEWKSKRLSDDNIKPPASSNNRIAPSLNCINSKSQVKFIGSCLKQEKVTFTYKKAVNIYIVYEISLRSCTQGPDFTLGSSLFEAIKLVKNTDPKKYSYSGYVIGFDTPGSFSLSDGNEFGKNVTTFDADMSSSVHIDS